MSGCDESPRRIKKGFFPIFWNKPGGKRASLERSQSRQAEGGPMVVKGISKRVIVVKSPDPKIFEQAIFIVREDFPGQTGISERELLRQARESINGYLLPGKTGGKLMPWLRGMLFAGLAAAAAAVTWVMVQMAAMM